MGELLVSLEQGYGLLAQESKSTLSSPESFVFSIQPAVCYQAITKKLKVCEEVKQIFILMDFYCYEALQFFQSYALHCYYNFSPPPLSSPCPTPSGDRIHLHPSSRQYGSQWQHHTYRQKVRSPIRFSHFLLSSHSTLSLRMNKPNISL